MNCSYLDWPSWVESPCLEEVGHAGDPLVSSVIVFGGNTKVLAVYSTHSIHQCTTMALSHSTLTLSHPDLGRPWPYEKQRVSVHYLPPAAAPLWSPRNPGSACSVLTEEKAPTHSRDKEFWKSDHTENPNTHDPKAIPKPGDHQRNHLCQTCKKPRPMVQGLNCWVNSPQFV